MLTNLTAVEILPDEECISFASCLTYPIFILKLILLANINNSTERSMEHYKKNINTYVVAPEQVAVLTPSVPGIITSAVDVFHANEAFASSSASPSAHISAVVSTPCGASRRVRGGPPNSTPAPHGRAAGLLPTSRSVFSPHTPRSQRHWSAKIPRAGRVRWVAYTRAFVGLPTPTAQRPLRRVLALAAAGQDGGRVGRPPRAPRSFA